MTGKINFSDLTIVIIELPSALEGKKKSEFSNLIHYLLSFKAGPKFPCTLCTGKGQQMCATVAPSQLVSNTGLHFCIGIGNSTE